MAERTPTTLYDLDRDELLRFIWHGAGVRFLICEYDLIRARWVVALERAEAAFQILISEEVVLGRLWGQMVQAHIDLQANPTDEALAAAGAAKVAADNAEDKVAKLKAKFDRLQRRADRLYAQLQEVRR